MQAVGFFRLLNFYSMKLSSLLLIFTLFLSSCDSFEDLSLVGQPDVKIKGINNGEIELDLLLRIKNPNSRSFKVKDASFAIYVNDANLGNSKMGKNITIDGNSTKEYAFPMKVKLNGEDLSLNLIFSTILQKQIKLRVDGHIKAGTFLINQKFPVEWEENVSL